MFIFRGAHVGQQHLLWRFVHHLPNYARESRITSWKPFKHAASITESLLRADCCWLSFFWQGLLAHPLQHALWLSPALSHNFRENIPIHRPRPSAGSALKEKRAPGALVFVALAKPHFWKLGYCIWSLFLETSKSVIRQRQRQAQGCASGSWRLAVAEPRLWKLGCYLWRVWLSTSTTTQGTKPERNRNSLGPFSCRTPGGSGWQPFT